MKDEMRLREMLLKRRRTISRWLEELESDWQTLADRDIELEEEAQKADLTSAYGRLDARGLEAIDDIDLALCRLAVGTYGICENCEQMISAKRLEAMPAKRLCVKCARRYKEKHKRLPPARKVISCAELPDEYKDLTDGEVEKTILEKLRYHGGVDSQELEVHCRKGVIYLEGALPSKAEHDTLMQTLTDVMGFRSVVDHLRIDELPWEREDPAPGKDPFPLSVDTDEISDDIFESQEKDVPYMFS
jgi:DnaK suppressor protein